MTWLRVLVRVHGAAGWLAAAALVHPAIVLRRRGRRARLAAWASTLVASLAAGLGMWIYPDYRARLKHDIFLASPAMGWLFEHKEHLGAGALLLAWAGLGTHLAAIATRDAVVREPLARASWIAYVLAAAMATATAVLGLAVSAYETF